MEKITTILPTKKVFNSSNKDLFINLDLKSNEQDLPLTENINTILNLSELLTTEREESKKYYLNGTIDIVAPFINSKKTPSKLTDIFNYYNGDDSKSNYYTINDLFKIHICIPDSLELLTGDTYKLYLKSLYSTDDKIIFKQSGFSQNLFSEHVYQYINKNSIDLSGHNDIISDDERIILPITDFYIFLEFKNNTKYSGSTVYDYNKLFYSEITYNSYEFSFTENNNFIETIKLPILSGTTSLGLEYIYNPFTKIKIKDFDNDVEFGNIKNETNIPYYAAIQNDETNNYQSLKSEFYVFNEFPIYSGTSRLTTSDPLLMLPRKFIYDTKTKSYVYFLDNTIYDINRLEINYSKYNDLSVKTKLEYYTDYYTDVIDTYQGINKLFFKLNGINKGDMLYFTYHCGENYIWRDLLANGIVDAENNIGVNFPFVNGYHYVQSNFKVIIQPNLDNTDTYNVYNTFKFSSENNKNILNNNFNQNC